MLGAATKVATRTALYRFFGANGTLLYIGITDQFGMRWTTHARKKPWWPEVQSHTAEWFDSREAAEEAEKGAIKTERPKHNIMHVPKPPQPRKPPRVKATSTVRADVEDDYWTLREIAAYWEITYTTARTYRSRGRGELPEPDKVFGRSPAWKPATIINHPRPGQGARTDLRSGESGE